MKNTILIASTIAAVSCSSTAETDQSIPNNNSQNHASESSAFKNMVGDTAITIAIKKNFLNDDKINSFNIMVVTINKKVQLTGTVPNNEVRQAAISIAKHTKAVEEVAANLIITEESLIKKLTSDAIVTARIKLAYLDDPDINSSDIKVKTVNGCVTLTGAVVDENIKERAINIARNTLAVQKVNADLKIDKSSLIKNIASDSAITSAIKLKYLQDNVLSGLDIHIKTINQEVTLSGIVKNIEEKERAISIAKLTNEVKTVQSQLEVQEK